ncbi:hypothetical protein fugu_018156 [Takifugu bimaculatus]|uniref:Uncharacterized protein n=1 Tax=Takifugu bimaculatus TaxID=433685 RepID=A0A4Z2BKA2_9TELE|nr:hypothetical protein fugu_018156 [Takifugu bimaculatus]
MVKHMLRTTAPLTLFRKSLFSPASRQFYRGESNKKKEKPPKKRHRVDNARLTALHFHSNRGVFTVVVWSDYFFHPLTQYGRKPCVCALCSSTVSHSGVVTVSGPERRSRLQLACARRLCCQSWKFRSPKAAWNWRTYTLSRMARGVFLFQWFKFTAIFTHQQQLAVFLKDILAFVILASL